MGDPKVFVLMPVARADRAKAAVKTWTAAGYDMVLYQDSGTTPFTQQPTLTGPYSGVWNATNLLARFALSLGADICVFAGDDMEPDPKKSPAEIGREYLEKFPTGLGLMQPCGDPQGVDGSGRPAAARICGSPWFGVEWIQRAYRGRGPTLGLYYHFYADEELYELAYSKNLLWLRPEITQQHLHWSWGHTQRQPYHERANTHFQADQQLFFKRQREGFPGGEFL